MGGVPDVDRRLPTLENRLDRLASLFEAANQHGNPAWWAEVMPGATDADLDEVEQELGRLLPEETRKLYGWHNGAITAIAPDLSFSPLRIALKMATSVAEFRLPPVSNKNSTVDLATVFPIFNIERILFNVLTVAPPLPRAKSSGVYVLDFERNQFTMIANTIRDLVEHLIEEIESGNSIYTEHGVRWRHDPYRFNPTMKPYGAGR